jgi:hypothetical protein
MGLLGPGRGLALGVGCGLVLAVAAVLGASCTWVSLIVLPGAVLHRSATPRGEHVKPAAKRLQARF